MATKTDKPFVKLRLDYVDSDYSRTLVVPQAWSLAFLHEVIQAAFGWLGYHAYAFQGPGERGVRYELPDDCGCSCEDCGRCASPEATAIAEVLGRKGSELTYEYDFGDGNQVLVTSLGAVAKIEPKDFASVGPDLIEDAGGLGFMPGIVKILRGSKRGGDYRLCVDWLKAMWNRTPEAVLREPEAGEIAGRVWRLVRAVETAIPKPPEVR